MSYSYHTYLIPNADDFDYVPSVETVVSLIQKLDAAGWVYHGPAPVEIRILGVTFARHLAAHETAANDVGRQWNGQDFLKVDLLPIAMLSDSQQECSAGSPDDLRPIARQSPPAEITFGSCWLVSLQVFPRLSLVSAGADGTTLACPSCGSDLYGAFEVVRPVQERSYWESFPVPTELTCTACGAAVDPLELVGVTPSGIDGTPKREPKPYFRICLEIVTDDPPNLDPAPVDPALLHALASATGVEFRALGRFR